MYKAIALLPCTQRKALAKSVHSVQDSGMRKSLLQQIQDAWEIAHGDGLTMVELLRRSKLALDVSVLSRKLSGAVALRTEECESLAAALGVEVSTGKGRRAS